MKRRNLVLLCVLVAAVLVFVVFVPVVPETLVGYPPCLKGGLCFLQVSFSVHAYGSVSYHLFGLGGVIIPAYNWTYYWSP